MKIGIINEKKQGLLIVSIIFAIMIIMIFLTSLDIVSKIGISIMGVIMYLIVLFCFSISMEWYVLDEESITVKNVFGKVNKVYYKDVKSTYVKRLPVFSRDLGIPCLLFNDGRKESGFLFSGSNIENNKKLMVRIPYTQEVIDYFAKNNIRLNENSVFKTLIE